MLFIGDQNCLNNAQPFASFPTSPMLGARPRPPLRRPPPPIVPGERAGFSSPATSPNWWRSQDSDGVGLGIVAALNKSGDHLPKPAAVVYSPRLCRSGQGPISVSARNLAGGGEWVDSDSECYTCVTCRGGHGQSPVTRVYYGGTEVGPGVQFELSSPTAKQEESANLHAGGGEKIGFLASDFLSSCYLCHKKLHGKDIYMYRYFLLLVLLFPCR